MVAYENGRPCSIQPIVRILNCEGYARRIPHDIFEAPRRGPLRDSSVADCTQEDGDDDTIDSADDEGEIGGQEAGKEASNGDSCGEHVQGERCGKVSGSEDTEVVQDDGHVVVAATARDGGYEGLIGAVMNETLSRRGGSEHITQVCWRLEVGGEKDSVDFYSINIWILQCGEGRSSGR